MLRQALDVDLAADVPQLDAAADALSSLLNMRSAFWVREMAETKTVTGGRITVAIDSNRSRFCIISANLSIEEE